MVGRFVRVALTIVVARWVYAEVQLTYPVAIPAINRALETIEIPTHDRWDKEKLNRIKLAVSEIFENS